MPAVTEERTLQGNMLRLSTISSNKACLSVDRCLCRWTECSELDDNFAYIVDINFKAIFDAFGTLELNPRLIIEVVDKRGSNIKAAQWLEQQGLVC